MIYIKKKILKKIGSIIPALQGISVIMHYTCSGSRATTFMQKEIRAGNKKPIFLWLISKTKPFHQTLSSPQWHGKTQVLYYRVIGFYQWRVLSSHLVQRPPSQRRREIMTSLKSHSKFMAEARQDPGPLTVVLQYHCPRAVS